MIEHISDGDLLLAFDGELTAERNEAVLGHTRTCAVCQGNWTNLKSLSQQVVEIRPVAVTLESQEVADARLLEKLDRSGASKKTHWTTRSLVFANSLAAVAVAITCMVLWPSMRVARQAAVGSAVVYDLEQPVPPGYVSLPFADPTLPLDDAEVLPVNLSAEDLELMGFDANETPQGGVKAELLIGMDGWPRAIRIVEQF